MEPEIWKKVLILTSKYPTLELREVWALSSHPQEREIYYLKEDGRLPAMKRFFILNLMAPGQNAALGICEDEIRWLRRGQHDTMLFQPPMIPASVWVDPNWTGL